MQCLSKGLNGFEYKLILCKVEVLEDGANS